MKVSVYILGCFAILFVAIKTASVAVNIDVARTAALGNSGITSGPATVMLSTKKSLAAETP